MIYNNGMDLSTDTQAEIISCILDVQISIGKYEAINIQPVN
jgi:hypothetical protein